ncbi:hypothetical protein Tco_1448339 [Tanacetum coccineum]
MKSSKEADSQKDPRSKEGKSSSSSKDTSGSHHKSSGKSAHAEKPIHTVNNFRVQKNQEFDTGNNDEQPNDEVAPKNDWFKKPERPPTPNPDCNKGQQVDFRPPQTWISVTARAEKPPTSFDEIMDTSIDFSAFFMNRLKITNLTQEFLVVYDKHAYCGTSHWGVKRQRLYGFASNRESMKDVYSRKRIIAVTRLKIIKRYDYGHLDEIEVRREDRDGILNDVQTALHDIASGIRMEYLPKRKWSGLDKRRARVMLQDIDKQLFQRRLIRNPEKFVGGRKYENDLSRHGPSDAMHNPPQPLKKDSILQAGNPVKEILLNLNLPDHRSILTDSKVKSNYMGE